MAETMFAISLRIEHPTLQCEIIAQELALQPVISYSAGEQRKTPKGTLLEGVKKKSYCCFDLLPKQAGDVADGIESLLLRLGPHASYFLRLTQEGGRAELFVGFFPEETGGFTLSTVRMANLVRLSLELSVEVYR